MSYSRETERQNKALGDLLKGKTPEKNKKVVIRLADFLIL